MMENLVLLGLSAEERNEKIKEIVSKGTDSVVSVISKLIEKADFSQITLNNQSVKLAHVTLSSLLPDENDNISELILTGMQEACVCILIKILAASKLSLDDLDNVMPPKELLIVLVKNLYYDHGYTHCIGDQSFPLCRHIIRIVGTSNIREAYYYGQISSYLKYVEDVFSEIEAMGTAISTEMNILKVEMSLELARALFFLGNYEGALKYSRNGRHYADSESILGVKGFTRLNAIERTSNMIILNQHKNLCANSLSPIYQILEAINSNKYTSGILDLFVVDIQKKLISEQLKAYMIERAFENNYYLNALIMGLCADLCHSLPKGNSESHIRPGYHMKMRTMTMNQMQIITSYCETAISIYLKSQAQVDMDSISNYLIRLYKLLDQRPCWNFFLSMDKRFNLLNDHQKLYIQNRIECLKNEDINSNSAAHGYKLNPMSDMRLDIRFLSYFTEKSLELYHTMPIEKLNCVNIFSDFRTPNLNLVSILETPFNDLYMKNDYRGAEKFVAIILNIWKNTASKDTVLDFVEQCTEKLLISDLIEALYKEQPAESTLSMIYNKIISSPHKVNLLSDMDFLTKLLSFTVVCDIQRASVDVGNFLSQIYNILKTPTNEDRGDKPHIYIWVTEIAACLAGIYNICDKGHPDFKPDLNLQADAPLWKLLLNIALAIGTIKGCIPTNLDFCQYFIRICNSFGGSFLDNICALTVEASKLIERKEGDTSDISTRYAHNNRTPQSYLHIEKRHEIPFVSFLTECIYKVLFKSPYDTSGIMLLSEMYRIAEDYKQALAFSMIAFYMHTDGFMDIDISPSTDRCHAASLAAKNAALCDEHICAVVLMQLLPHKDYATMFDLIQQGFRNSPFYGNSGKDIFIRYSKASEIVDLDGLTPTSCITDSNITGFIYEHCKRVGNTLLPKMLKTCRFSKHVCMLSPDGQRAYVSQSYRVYFRKLMSRILLKDEEISA